MVFLPKLAVALAVAQGKCRSLSFNPVQLPYMSTKQVPNDSSIDRALPLLLGRIEQKLSWGDGNDWSSADFSKLSESIFSETGKRLSVTTLKRAWGRTSQASKPSATTLNILAAYVGETHWRALAQESQGVQEQLPKARDQKKSAWWFGLLFAGAAGIILLVVALSPFTDKPPPTADLDPDLVTFSVDKVSQGIPNTVVFRYDLGGQQVDSLELQQTWDDSRRIGIDPDGELVTATYLSPGYYKAKLVANGQIVKSQSLYLPSNGFDVYAFAEGAEDFHQLDSNFWTLTEGGFSYNDNYKGFQAENAIGHQQLLNLLPAPTVSADTFTFHARFLMSTPTKGDLCHGLGISLVAEEEAYFFRLGKRGCSGRFTIFLGQQEISGGTTDLSAMGFAADTWVDLNIIKQGNRLSLRLNDQVILVSEEAPNFGPFGGVRLFSEETLSLRGLSFEDADGMVDLLEK